MRENIEWLIEQYTETIERLERDAQEQSLGISFITGQITAYKRVIEDLQTLLDESEDKE
jgi:hypothetical protein